MDSEVYPSIEMVEVILLVEVGVCADCTKQQSERHKIVTDIYVTPLSLFIELSFHKAL